MNTTTSPPTPETDAATFKILSSLQSGTEKVVHAEICAKLERELNEAREQLEAMREAIKEGYDALTECVDDSGELLAEHGWWKDEPRCDYQIRYDEHKQRIENAEAALTKLKPFIKPK